MSYSFSVRAADKAAARAAISAEFDKVVEQQPIHSADRDQAQGTAEAMLDLIPEPASDAEQISVSVNGYVQWKGVLGGDDPVTITGASVAANASVVAKPPAS